MEWVFTFLFLAIIGLPVLVGVGIGWYFLGGKDTIAANNFKNKVYSLNPLKGKTRKEIEAVLGPPSSWFAAGENRLSCSWDRRKYYITLLFTDDICEGVSSEMNI